jgi:hypothetical protein
VQHLAERLLGHTLNGGDGAQQPDMGRLEIQRRQDSLKPRETRKPTCEGKKPTLVSNGDGGGSKMESVALVRHA